MYPPRSVATSLEPSADAATATQFPSPFSSSPAPVCCTHVAPESSEVKIYPFPDTPATSFIPSADDATELHDPDPALSCCTQLSPESVEV